MPERTETAQKSREEIKKKKNAADSVYVLIYFKRILSGLVIIIMTFLVGL